MHVLFEEVHSQRTSHKPPQVRDCCYSVKTRHPSTPPSPSFKLSLNVCCFCAIPHVTVCQVRRPLLRAVDTLSQKHAPPFSLLKINVNVFFPWSLDQEIVSVMSMFLLLWPKWSFKIFLTTRNFLFHTKRALTPADCTPGKLPTSVTIAKRSSPEKNT